MSLELVKKFKNDLATSLYKNITKTESICSQSLKHTLKNTVFDRCFYSGLPSNVITEIFGPAGAGKSQICLHLIAQTLISDNNSKALYISTQERFPIERFNSVLNLSLNESVLDRLHLQYFLEPESELHFLSFGLMGLMNEFQYKLIVYDGIASNSRIIGAAFEKAAHIQQIIACFRRLFQTHTLIVFITNQVTDVPTDADSDIKVSALGLTLENCVNIKICLEKDKNSGMRTMNIMKSLFTPLEKEYLIISDKGVEIIEE